MRAFIALMLMLMPAVASAQTEEDEPHRVDRQHTQDLNHNVQRAVAARQAADDAKLARYRAAEQDYERRRAEWRRRFDACQQGDTRACNPY